MATSKSYVDGKVGNGEFFQQGGALPTFTMNKEILGAANGGDQSVSNTLRHFPRRSAWNKDARRSTNTFDGYTFDDRLERWHQLHGSRRK